jgi:hypothetical protein
VVVAAAAAVKVPPHQRDLAGLVMMVELGAKVETPLQDQLHSSV